MEFGKAITGAFSYARHSKAVPAFTVFFLGTIGVFLLIGWLAVLATRVSFNPTALMRNPAALAPLAIIFLAGVLALILGGIALSGTVIRNSVNNESLSQSWKAFLPRFWTLVGLTVVTLIASTGTSRFFDLLSERIAAASGLFFVLNLTVSLALALALAFAEYAAVLEGTGVVKSIRNSVKLAINKPVDVLLAILVSGLVGFLILLAVAAALLVVLAAVMLATRASIAAPSTPVLVAAGIAIIVAALGLFFSNVFQLHFMAHVFKNFKRGEKSTPPHSQNTRLRKANPKKLQKTAKSNKTETASKPRQRGTAR